MSPDFFAYLKKMNNDLTEAIRHISNSNYGLAQKQLRDVYANNITLQTFIDGGLEDMAAEAGKKGKPLVIDVTEIPDED